MAKDELEELLEQCRIIAEKKMKAGIERPEDVAGLVLADMNGLEQEELWVILLNQRNKVVHIEHLYKGTINSSSIRIAEIFKEAVRHNAPAIIVVHNHPSGDPNPSPEDVHVTKVIREAGGLLDIELLDHLIIGGGRFISMKAKGLGFD